jgi:hypothetical protein
VKYIALSLAAAAFTLAPVIPARAQATSNANDTACGAIMCLDGAMSGSPGGASCAAYETAYFSLIVPSVHGINWTATRALRKAFLRSCGTGAVTNAAAVTAIQARYGHSIGL